MKSLVSTAGKVAKAGGISIDAAERSFRSLASSYLEYKKASEEGKTKRAMVASWRDTQLAQIEKDRRVLELYLVGTFKERASNIEAFFARLDTAIEKGNDQLIAQTIGAILSIAKESPLTEARELVEAMRSNDVKVIDI